MNKVMHAHMLMDFIQKNPKASSLSKLKSEFEKQFGEVMFTNCTNQVYTFEEILLFLSQRNKIQNNSEGVKVIKEHRCDHE
jgi:probable metal-binding protein